jgi:predicted MFS family arabinose efflux permease
MYTVLSAATSLRIGASILIVGCWFRQICSVENNKFWYIIVGQFIISFANPIYLSASNIIANRWFADNERALATSMIGLSIPLGSVCAFI